MLIIAGVGKFFSISPVGDKMVTSIKIVNMPVLGRILGDPHRLSLLGDRLHVGRICKYNENMNSVIISHYMAKEILQMQVRS